MDHKAEAIAHFLPISLDIAPKTETQGKYIKINIKYDKTAILLSKLFEMFFMTLLLISLSSR